MRFKTKLDERILKNRSGTGPGLAQHPIDLPEIGCGQPFTRDKFVFRGNNHNKLIPCDGRPGELLDVTGFFHEAQFRAVALDCPDDLRRIAYLEAYLDLWIRPTKRYQMTGQPITRDRLGLPESKARPALGH
jgi:hypothetical protein